MNENNALISIAGGWPFELVFTTDGHVEKQNDRLVLTFEETELSGEQGVTTCLIVEDGAVSLLRGGGSDTFMYFANHRQSLAEVETTAGPATLSVFTHELSVSGDEEGGQIDLHYTLELNGQCAENSIWVNYKTHRRSC